MTKLQRLNELADLFQFKAIFDKNKTAFVVFEYNSYAFMKDVIADKTGFEAFENHVQLLGRIPRAHMANALGIGTSLGKAVLASLVYQFPGIKFRVYVFVIPEESMTLCFHQVWPDEEPFCKLSDFENKDEVVLLFENE